MDIKGSYCRGRDTRTVILNGCNDCPFGHALKSPVFQFPICNNFRNNEIQCFFNKVASAPQSAVNKSTIYVLFQTYCLERIMRLCLSLLQLLSFLVNCPKRLFGQLIAAVMTLTCTHFGNLRAPYIIVLTLPSHEACSFCTQLLELLKIQSVVPTTS